MPYHPIHRAWLSKKAMYITMIFELGAVVGVLVMFGIAQPDTYRSQLWQAGDDLGFNSSPSIILYSYANFEPFPKLPFVWSQTLTDFNVAISVLSLFLLITKLVAFIMHVWFPILACFANLAMMALYIASIYGQAGPDYLDPERPSPVAWYIAKPCTVAASYRIQDSCKNAKGSFAVTIIMFTVYVAHMVQSSWAMVPNEADKRPLSRVEDSDDEELSPAQLKKQAWEMRSMPATPMTGGMPFTPRTTAFNTLDRGTYR